MCAYANVMSAVFKIRESGGPASARHEHPSHRARSQLCWTGCQTSSLRAKQRGPQQACAWIDLPGKAAPGRHAQRRAPSQPRQRPPCAISTHHLRGSSSSSSLCSAPSAAARATGCAGGRTGRRLTTTTTAAPRRRCCRRRSACERAKCVGYSGEGDGEGGVADRCVHEDHHFYGRRDI